MKHIASPRFLVFLGLLLGLCALAAVTVVNWLVRRFISPDWPPKKLVAGTKIGLVAAGALVVACVGYGYYIEPNWLAVERVRILSEKLPAGSRPIRVVHISDLHSQRSPRLEKELPEIVAAERPDLIAFTGDAVNGIEGVEVFRDCIGRLALLAPTFVTYGTGDGVGLKAGMYEGTGVRDVSAGSAAIEVAGAAIIVEGTSFCRRRLAKKPESDAPDTPDALRILLSHYPTEGADLLDGSDVDLCLAGNTHGGQVRLPLFGPIAGTPSDRRYLAGLYRVDKSWLYVNRGLGMSDHAPPVRFGARPEVTVIEIAPAR